MRLHRLTLSNYRGIAQRDIEFPDRGVVVVSGANEVGKSSMIEALDLLIKAKDRSKNKDVKAAKPTHVDAGAEVTAEISTGGYRFVYYKRFHKRPETRLTLIEPHREQLTGDEAHERVSAILDDTLDAGLWEALRVLQSGSTETVDLSGSDALSRALDIAAGDTAEPAGTEPLLIERIDAEYGRYFTPTGKLTGEWSAASNALSAAEAELNLCTELVAEVEDRVDRHAELTSELADLADQQGVADIRYATAKAAGARVAELRKQQREADLVADKATATSATSGAAHTERQRLRADFDDRTAAVADLKEQLAAVAEHAVAIRQAAEAAAAAASTAEQSVVDAEQRVQTTRGVVDQLVARDEADRLSARLSKIDTAQREYEQYVGDLATITLTADQLVRIEEAVTALDRAHAAVAAVSATVDVIAHAEIHLVADAQRVTLSAGQDWTGTAPTEVDVAGVLTLRVTPGASGADAHADHVLAQQELTDALAVGGVDEPAAARGLDQRRRELAGERDRLRAVVDTLRGEDDIDELRTRLAELTVGQPDIPADSTVVAARSDLSAAEALHRQVAADSQTRRTAAADAATQLVENTTRATVLDGQLGSQRTELEATRNRLDEQRALLGDDELAAQAGTDRQEARAAGERVAELATELAAADPDTVDTELAAAGAAAQDLRSRHAEISRALQDIEVELVVFGSQGRKSRLDDAQTAREHAAATGERVGRRARAADLLRSVMIRHRDDTRLRYVRPFRAEVERLGRGVFGDSFEIDIDTDLRIRTRTLDGVTVPYESLSGGAKEQLGILARLAGAALVAPDDNVPVLIDDALGFTDPGRLATMGAVFGAVGAHGQVIVLTCTPERYDSVVDAHRIDLDA